MFIYIPPQCLSHFPFFQLLLLLLLKIREKKDFYVPSESTHTEASENAFGEGFCGLMTIQFNNLSKHNGWFKPNSAQPPANTIGMVRHSGD